MLRNKETAFLFAQKSIAKSKVIICLIFAQYIANYVKFLINICSTKAVSGYIFSTKHNHTMTPKQDPIRSMQHVLVDLRYEKAYICNNLIKCNFCYFNLMMPHTLNPLGCRTMRPPPSACHYISHIKNIIFSSCYGCCANLESL